MQQAKVEQGMSFTRVACQGHCAAEIGEPRRALDLLAAHSGQCAGWRRFLPELETGVDAATLRPPDKTQIEGWQIRTAGALAAVIDRTDGTVRPARRSSWQELRGIVLPLDHLVIGRYCAALFSMMSTREVGGRDYRGGVVPRRRVKAHISKA